MTVARYATAIAQWLARGRPRRSPEEVARIFTGICQPCEHFTKSSKCKLCGCRLSLSPNAATNKIAMATEACPAGKWS